MLDISGWDLRKALELGHSANPTLLEWLRSPICYRHDAARVETLKSLCVAAYARDRAYHHYLSMARKNYRGYLQGETVRHKKYLYVLRPLLAARWVASRDDVPPMVFADLAEAVLHEAPLIAAINRLLSIKMRAGEAESGPAWPELNAFIEGELLRAAALAPAKAERPSLAAMDAFLFRCVAESLISA